MVNVSRKSDDRRQFTLVKTKSYRRLLKEKLRRTCTIIKLFHNPVPFSAFHFQVSFEYINLHKKQKKETKQS